MSVLPVSKKADKPCQKPQKQSETIRQCSRSSSVISKKSRWAIHQALKGVFRKRKRLLQAKNELNWNNSISTWIGQKVATTFYTVKRVQQKQFWFKTPFLKYPNDLPIAKIFCLLASIRTDNLNVNWSLHLKCQNIDFFFTVVLV